MNVFKCPKCGGKTDLDIEKHICPISKLKPVMKPKKDAGKQAKAVLIHFLNQCLGCTLEIGRKFYPSLFLPSPKLKEGDWR